MVPTTCKKYLDRLRTVQCKFSCKVSTIRVKRCLMIPVDTTKEKHLYESIKLLNTYDARDFDEASPKWNVLTQEEITELLEQVEEDLC